MALVKGTNCGFVAAAPVGDPATGSTVIDGHCNAYKDVAPAEASKIIEMGWWHSANINAGDFDIGIYTHNAGLDLPDVRLHVSANNSRDVNQVWDSVVVDWVITPGTTYWLAIQCDAVAADVKIDYAARVGERRSLDFNRASLITPWVSDGAAAYILAVYARYQAVAEENSAIMLGADF